jgi:hypothetical protein
VEESPSWVPEWPLLSCLQCVWSGVVMLKNHSSTRAFFVDFFLQTAKSLSIAFSSDGQVPLKQFIMDNPFHIPPDAAPNAECHSSQNFLGWSAHNIFGCIFSNRVFSVDWKNVSGGLCSFGASIEPVKKKV